MSKTEEASFICNATEPIFGFFMGEVKLVNLHDPALCEGRGCVVHHPTDHHMIDWPLTWRGDKGVFERQCRHNVGHPDPDDAAYLQSIGKEAYHCCCMEYCCAP